MFPCEDESQRWFEEMEVALFVARAITNRNFEEWNNENLMIGKQYKRLHLVADENVTMAPQGCHIVGSLE